MYGFYVVLSAETASFRDPGGQLYHATLPLPPITTIIGIAGAALGVPFQEIWGFFKERKIHVGARDISYLKWGVPPGRGLDLWKYQKIVTNDVRSDILKREFLFRPVYRLYYGSEDQGPLEQVWRAFFSPAWALSLGTSDDIARIEELSPIETIKEISGGTVKLCHCLIPGDQSDNYSFNWEVISKTPIRQPLELPLVKQLPVEFLFNPNGERKGCKYKPFTFLTEIQQLKNPCPAYVFGQEAVPLTSITHG